MCTATDGAAKVTDATVSEGKAQVAAVTQTGDKIVTTTKTTITLNPLSQLVPYSAGTRVATSGCSTSTAVGGHVR